MSLDLGKLSNAHTFDIQSHTSFCCHHLQYARRFNQNLASWNVSQVENMEYMFGVCDDFDSSIGDWDTSKVQSMAGMFANAPSFNQDISGWDTSEVLDMESMFWGRLYS